MHCAFSERRILLATAWSCLSEATENTQVSVVSELQLREGWRGSDHCEVWFLNIAVLSAAWLSCIHLCPAWGYQPFFSALITVWSVTISCVESSRLQYYPGIPGKFNNFASYARRDLWPYSRLPLSRLVWKYFGCCVTLWIVLSALKQGCFFWKQSFSYFECLLQWELSRV